MSKKNSAVAAYATFQPLSAEKLTGEFVSRERTLSRAFSELGKIFVLLASKLTNDKGRGISITKLLLAEGVSQNTISNAQYASKAWALVASGVISEGMYDVLTRAECIQINKIGPEKSKVAFSNRHHWRDELASLYKSGKTLAELKAEADASAPSAEAEDASEQSEASESSDSGAPDTPGNVVHLTTDADTSAKALQDRALLLLNELDNILNQVPDKAPLLDLINAMVETHAPKASARKAA